jgi:3-hydroxyanthranilate 3,4-dioxygenase
MGSWSYLWAPVNFMSNTFTAPFNLNAWIAENRHLLKPPVGNQQLYKANKDFIVMVVGGPNSRKDFHINQGEELFYQLEGDVELHLMVDDEGNPGKRKKEIVALREGDLFLLPPGVPHGPRRGPGTVGLVIERYRDPNEKDGFQWYCENCGNLLYEVEIPVSDIVGQLSTLMNDFFSDTDKCTCRNCGTVMQKP